MTQVAEFAHHFPSWVDKDGLPLSWKHFVMGVRFLGKDAIMRTIDMAAAVRAGNATPDEYKDWRRDLMRRV